MNVIPVVVVVSSVYVVELDNVDVISTVCLDSFLLSFRIVLCVRRVGAVALAVDGAFAAEKPPWWWVVLGADRRVSLFCFLSRCGVVFFLVLIVSLDFCRERKVGPCAGVVDVGQGGLGLGLSLLVGRSISLVVTGLLLSKSPSWQGSPLESGGYSLCGGS